MKKILFYIDQKKRDFLSAYLIGSYLKKKYNYIIDYCTSSDALYKYISFRPQIVVIGNPDIYHGNFAKFFSIYSNVFSIPTEQAIFEKKDFIERIIGGHNRYNKDFPPPQWEVVDKIYLWSNHQYNCLKDIDYLSSKLVITGCSRLMELTALEENFKDSVLEQKKDLTIGIASENEHNNLNMADYLFRFRDYKINEYGGSVDIFSWMFIKITLLQMKVIEAIYKYSKNIDLIFRPRFFEKISDYFFLNKISKNIIIDSNDSPLNFIKKSDLIFLCQSSLGYEALINATPVVSIFGLMEEEAKKFNISFDKRFRFYYKIKSNEDLKNPNFLIKSSLNLIKNNDFLEFINEYYYPINLYKKNKKSLTHPTFLIAEDINNTELYKFETKKSFIYTLDILRKIFSTKYKVLYFIIYLSLTFKFLRPLIYLVYFLKTLKSNFLSSKDFKLKNISKSLNPKTKKYYDDFFNKLLKKYPY